MLIGGIALATSGFLLLLVSGYLVRAVARPVRVVASGASRIAAGDLSTRIPEAGPAEIRELTSAFNTMAESVEHGRRELEVQNEQLRQSERAKSELITIVSHELRTPLSSILGYTRLMLKRDTDQRTRRKYVEIIHDQGERLAGLIEGFLAADDRNGTGIELAPDAVDLGELVRREVELIAADSPDHDLSVTVDQKPLTVHADGERLAQVVINLVTNAVKYSPSGGAIRVEVRRHGQHGPRQRPGRGPRNRGRAPVARLQQVLPGRGARERHSRRRARARALTRDRRGARGPDRFHEHRGQGLDLLVRAARLRAGVGGPSPKRGISSREVAMRLPKCYQCSCPGTSRRKISSSIALAYWLRSAF